MSNESELKVTRVALPKEQVGLLTFFASLSEGLDIVENQGNYEKARELRRSLYTVINRIRESNELNSAFVALRDTIGARGLDLLIHWSSSSNALETSVRNGIKWESKHYRRELAQIRQEFRNVNRSK